MRRRALVLAGRLFDAAVLFVVAGLVVCTILSLLSERLWMGELAVHFRMQYLGLAVPGTLLAAVRRRWLVCACASGVALVNAWPAMPYLMPDRALSVSAGSGANEPASGISLLELNLLYRNQEYGRVREYLGARAPDVLVLTELTASWVRELQPVTARYPYGLALPRESPWGLGVYSRYPLDAAQFNDLGEPGSVNVSASLRSPAGPVSFFAVHLASPTSVAATRTRNRQLQVLAGLLSAARPALSGSRPRILVGDLNVTPFSPRFAALLDYAGMVDARRGRGWQGTWPSMIPALRIPIDACLVDRASRVTDIRRGPFVGSDHLPLEVQLDLARDSAG